MPFRNITLFFILFCVNNNIYSQNILRTFPNEAFTEGEVLKYRVHYGFIDAGEAVLEIKKANMQMGGRNCFHAVATGKSLGAFNWFFKVDDRYETFIDKNALVPWLFIRRVSEGGYTLSQNVSFNHFKNTAVSNGKEFDSIPPNIQDMISAFYFSRAIDYSTAKPGDTFTITGFVDDEVVPIKIRYVGKEIIKTDLGKFRCIKFRPVVITGRIFKDEEDLNMWVTDDKNHIPLRAEAKILVGSIKMDITYFSGLANEVSKITGN